MKLVDKYTILQYINRCITSEEVAPGHYRNIIDAGSIDQLKQFIKKYPIEDETIVINNTNG